MKLRIWNIGLVFILAMAFVLGACGNALEGGSTPSGSIIRVVSVLAIDPASDTVLDRGTIEADIFLTPCSGEGEDAIFEKGLFNEYAEITMRNVSRPNTPEGASTSSLVTMNRYRVDYAIMNMSGSLPGLDGGGLSLSLEPDGDEEAIALLVFDAETKEYVRSHFPEVGKTRSMTVRADITIWGEDAFQTTVKAEGSITIVVTDFSSCSG